jgi:flagellar biogenesis protein FliO
MKCSGWVDRPRLESGGLPMTLRPDRALWRLRAGFPAIVVLLLGAARANGEGPVLKETRGDQSVQPGALASATTGGALVSAMDDVEESRKVEDRSRTSSRLRLPRRSSSAGRAYGSDAWYLALASVAALLAAVGGLALAARRFNPRMGSGALHVVSRVSLSPKHTVYLVRAGGRVLLVGTGPQGAPTLISELDDIALSPIEPARGQGEGS